MQHANTGWGWGGGARSIPIHARVYSQDGGLRVPLVGTRYLAAAALRSGRGPDPARDDAAARARGPAEEAAAALPRTAALCGAGSSSSLDSLSSLSLSESPSSPSPAPSATGASASLGSRFTLVRYPMNNLASWFDGSSSRTAAASARTQRMRSELWLRPLPARRGDGESQATALSTLHRSLRLHTGMAAVARSAETSAVRVAKRARSSSNESALEDAAAAAMPTSSLPNRSQLNGCAETQPRSGALDNVSGRGVLEAWAQLAMFARARELQSLTSGWRSFGPLNGHHTLARYACMTTQAGL